MDNKDKDAILLERIKQGDETAFKSLFDKYYRLLCYTAHKVLPDEHKAKDIAQEVFLSLWNKRDTLTIHTSLQAFLRRATVNKTIDFIRSQRLNFEESPDLGDDPNRLDEQMEYDELKTLIHRTAEQLPERCRMVFFMSRFEEMSHKEIASAMNISEKTVENQITKALKLLRSAVARYRSATNAVFLVIANFVLMA